jgi:septal ring factor EnvC (AmiA/AmiB activator)
MNLKTFATLSMLICFSITLSAQRIRAVETSDKLGDATKAVTVMVFETPQSTVEKEWKSFMKKNDGKLSTESGVIVAHNVLIKELGNYVVTVYARAEKEDDGVKLIVSVAPESELTGMKRVIENFSRELTKESIAEQQKDAEKDLDNAERMLAHLERDNSDLHNTITRLNEKIKDAEKDIEKNLKAQEDAKKVLEEKRKNLNAVKDKAINVN